jgi:hypothetical protein
VLFEDASDASNVLREPILCRKMNVVELAFYEVRSLPQPVEKVGIVQAGGSREFENKTKTLR